MGYWIEWILLPKLKTPQWIVSWQLRILMSGKVSSVNTPGDSLSMQISKNSLCLFIHKQVYLILFRTKKVKAIYLIG